jgi:dihydroxyacetone kinase phosphoprotein-dependent L subunit
MATQHLATAHAGFVVRDMIQTIVAQRQYLSEVDGAIGDGDHGVNMSKGFAQCRDKLDRIESTQPMVSLVKALDELTETLLDGIGGSMGPLYGTFFMSFADEIRHDTELDRENFGRALHAAIEGVQTVGDAKRGDKTLMDTLLPAYDRYSEAMAANASFADCLQALSDGAAEGMESTRALQARIGRASRLGARSIGVLDAGACSCCFILQSIAQSVSRALETEQPGVAAKAI